MGDKIVLAICDVALGYKRSPVYMSPNISLPIKVKPLELIP